MKKKKNKNKNKNIDYGYFQAYIKFERIVSWIPTYLLVLLYHGFYIFNCFYNIFIYIYVLYLLTVAIHVALRVRHDLRQLNNNKLLFIFQEVLSWSSNCLHFGLRVPFEFVLSVLFTLSLYFDNFFAFRSKMFQEHLLHFQPWIWNQQFL